MKKVKNVGVFIAIVLIIIFIYFIILNNIMKLTLDYNGQLLIYQNKYEIENKEDKIRQYMEPNETTSRFTSEEIDNRILNNKITVMMFQTLLDMDEKNIEEYIKSIDNKKIISDTKYGDIICIKGIGRQMAFTDDFKNLYYYFSRESVEVESNFLESLKDVPEEISKNKESILKDINVQLLKMKLQKKENFTADSIAIQRYLVGNDQNYHYIYHFEDKTSKMQVSYDCNDKIIKKIIIGFE